MFYMPGTYVPEGKGVVWKPGFWAKTQPGWDWIPSRWIRTSDGWDFRDGYWLRSPLPRRSPFSEPRNAPIVSEPRNDAKDRHVVGRPTPGQESGASDLRAIPDDEIPRAGGTEGPPLPSSTLPSSEEPGSAETPTRPPTTAPATAPVHVQVPIPYWDGRRFVVPPTRLGAGVVVDLDSGLPGDLAPRVGVIPPVSGNAVQSDPGMGPRGPRGVLFGGRVRGFFDRILP